MNTDNHQTRDFFDRWADDGSAERMEQQHQLATKVAFNALTWQPGWHLLDVGCGNGWATRMAAERAYLGQVTGIELSPNMAARARDLSAERANIEIIETDLAHLDLADETFDLVHANESLYYIHPIADAIKTICRLLKPGGRLICVVDYYLENEASHEWQESVDAPMQLLSESDYADLCRAAGFAEVTTQRVTHPTAEEGSWEKTVGSLLITATR